MEQQAGFLIPLSRRRPVLAFQSHKQRKIDCLLLFRQAQVIPRKVVAVDYFSLDRPLDIGKRVFRISVAGESQRMFEEPHVIPIAVTILRDTPNDI